MSFHQIRLIVLVLIFSVTGSHSASAENVLRWASAAGATTFDPHSGAALQTTLMQLTAVFEPLLEIDHHDLKIVVTALASDWKMTDALTWEFNLRPGVRFHDGSVLTSTDVVFSLERARANISEWRQILGNIDSIVADGALRVRITTREPDPLLWTKIYFMLIMPKAWAEQHHTTIPEDHVAGETSYATRHAVGSGAFMLEEFEPGVRTVLVCNANWWGLQNHPHNIDRIVHTVIKDPDAGVKALFDGEVDFLQYPPFQALVGIRNDPALKLEQTTELRSLWLNLSQKNEELHSSNIKGNNPFRDKRVHQAMYQGINIKAIQAGVMLGFSIPAGILAQPGVEGYTPELDQRLPNAPDSARNPLVQAGYADGFSVTLDCPNDHYANDELICRTVASQLGDIGLNIAVNTQPVQDHSRKVGNGQSDFWMESIPSGAAGSQQLFRYGFHSQGAWNDTGYANPHVDELIDQLDMTSVSYAREAVIEEIWHTIKEDIAYLPLHHEMVIWAMRRELELPVDPKNWPRFHLARFK